MTIPFGRYIRSAVLAAVCLAAVEANRPEASASTWIVPLAQAAPGKMYVMEGIVVVLLFAAAIFAVCRSSGRS